MHNTLASSDYGLLDSNTFMPRPNFWAALLWNKFMGATVLDPGPSTVPAVHLYAHCLKDQPGDVAVLVINTDKDPSHSLEFAAASERYTLTAQTLEATSVQLNGSTLELGAGDALPRLNGARASSGQLTLGAASITFLIFANANNRSCR
jgi:hypothetical protein